MLIAEAVSMLSHGAHAPAIAQAAVPIIPILLLPFAIVFFVLVFPIWLVSAGLLGLVVLVVRGIAAVVHRVKPGALDTPLAATKKAQRWVWTFGGYLDSWRA